MDDVFTKHRLLGPTLKLLTFLVPITFSSGAGAAAPGDAQNGAQLYQQHCAQCHDGNLPRTPTRASLQRIPPAQVLQALETGPMRVQGAQRTAQERAAIATFLSTSSAPASQSGDGYSNPDLKAYTCRFKHPELDLNATRWNGWGNSLTNTRFQPSQDSGLNAANVGKLRLRWAFGFPDVDGVAVQPVVIGRHVFVGSASGRLYVLDLKEGCLYWTFDAKQQIRSAVSVGRVGNGELAAFFTDSSANVYSVNAQTGALRWTFRVGMASGGRSTGAPKLYEGRLYVPLNASDEGHSSLDKECCKTHGSVVAMDADTGKIIWEASTLREKPRPTRKNSVGTQLYGPSGAGVWSSPTIDVDKRRLYVATANANSDPAGPTSDAILAYDLDTGKMLWVHQTTANDAWTAGCDRKPQVACPQANGPDFDYGQSPILVTLENGKRMIVAAQKSGMVYGLDPDEEGRRIWATRVSVGGTMGGSQWGSAVDGRNIYVAISDVLDLQDDWNHSKNPGGLVALRLTDGKLLWRTDVNACHEHEGNIQREPGYVPVTPLYFGCAPAQSAAITVTPGVVFSGSEDGHLRAYATDTGKVLWDMDTARSFYTVNELPSRGGSIDGSGGPVAIGGILLTPSGYSKWREMPGNVLLAYDVGP